LRCGGDERLRYVRNPDPNSLPANYFQPISDLAPHKPVAIAQTGWPAENVTAPSPIFIPANDISQAMYLDRVLKEFRQNNALFVYWILVRNYDALWEKELSQSNNAFSQRQWKDIGLINGNGWPRFWGWWIWNAYRNIQ
jgi:hypothetical protein